jgi:predicted amidohydrolase
LVKIILIQALPAPRLESRENLDRALKLLGRCRRQPADLICFPEYFPFFGEDELARAARDLGAYVVAGLLEEHQGKSYNSATLFDREGNLAGRQRKVSLGQLERLAFQVVPGAGWQVLNTDFGRLGLPVCIDLWGQPEAARQLAAQGADLLVNPALFPILRGHWPVGALTRAFDYYLPVAGVNTAAFVAEIAGRRYPYQGGGSFGIQPPVAVDEMELAHLVRNWDSLQDWFVVQGGEAEEILSLDLDLEGARHWRPLIQERFGFSQPASQNGQCG